MKHESTDRYKKYKKESQDYILINMEKRDYSKSVLIKYCNYLNNTLIGISAETVIGYDSHYTKNYYLHCIDIIEEQLIINEKIGDTDFDNQLISFIDVISRYIYPMVSAMQRPWRWDYDRNERIRNLLLEKATHISGLFDQNNYWKV